MIQLKDLGVIFHLGDVLETHALKNINLQIEKGDFITIIGGNGSGKSTLLNAISGEVPVTCGTIFLHNRSIERLPVYKRACFIARVFQDPLLGSCANLTIEENMLLALNRGLANRLQSATNTATRRYLQEQLARLDLGLENRLQDAIGKLSGGQRQAISLLMVSLQPSDLLLLDEHTAALDPKTADKVLALTKDIVTEHQLTTLMVTHSMQQALAVGNRTLMLQQGEIIADVQGEKRNSLQVSDLLSLFVGA